MSEGTIILFIRSWRAATGAN